MAKHIILAAVLIFSNVSIGSQTHEIEISIDTLINTKTLFSYPDIPESVYKAILRLPDLSEYTESSKAYAHVNAHYLEGELPGRSAEQLISELIDLAKNAHEYLNVNYLIDKQHRYQIESGGSVYAPRPFCADVLYETITVRFQNGLTLQSREWDRTEVPMEFCDEKTVFNGLVR